VKQRQRRAASQLLSSSLDGNLDLAHRIETCLFEGCGNRCGPGAYNQKLKVLASNLKSNTTLQVKLKQGAVDPFDLVRYSLAQLQSEEQQASHHKAVNEMFHFREIKEPPANVVGVAVCVCGCSSQVRIAYLRAGSSDVNKFATRYVCTKCNREVFVNAADVLESILLRHTFDEGGSVEEEEDPSSSEDDESLFSPTSFFIGNNVGNKSISPGKKTYDKKLK